MSTIAASPAGWVYAVGIAAFLGGVLCWELRRSWRERRRRLREMRYRQIADMVADRERRQAEWRL